MLPSVVLAAALLAAPFLAPSLVAQGSHADHGAPPAAAPTAAERLGTIRFPTSAAPAARREFERGVVYLHNFHYPQAVAAFRRARAIDPRDAMSAAFEALAHTHQVWNQQDTAAARAALRALAPTREARAALARTPRERAWLDAVEALYAGDAPKRVRDTAFVRATARLHADDPSDPEAAAFHALALLGLGERDAVSYPAAEALADSVLRAHPEHPGALHYKIHAVDDPPNATRGIAAAATYGRIAPDAAHAQHMTSHVFIALGRWADVERANRLAHAAQSRDERALGHGTHWLAYALVQQGRAREARAWADSMLAYQRAVAAGTVRAARGRSDADGYAVRIPATWVADLQAWDSPLTRLRPDTTHLRNPSVRAAADFLVGYAAARRAARPVDVTPGSRAADAALADSLLARMDARNAAAGATRPTGEAATYLAEAEAMALVLRAERVLAAGRSDSAVALLREAASRVEARPFIFGPPAVPVPPRERAADLLRLAGRHPEALAELDRAERTAPGRTQAMLVRARALAALGRGDEARRAYAALDSIWRRADTTFAERTAARVGSGAYATALGGTPARVDTVTYASGPLALRGVVYAPPGAGRHPAVALLHGSGGCWRPVEAELLGRMLAARGYVAFLPCRRGLGLSRGQGEPILDQLRREGLTTRDSAYAARSTALLETRELDDVKAALAALRARPDVDAGRVGVAGVSYGGILTLLAAEAHPALRAAVAFAPAAMNWGWNAPLRARLDRAARGSRVPLLVLQAENDWHLGPTRELPAAARAAGRDAAGKLYPAVGESTSDGHGLMELAPDLWERDVLAFLERHVKGARAASARAPRP